MGIRIHKKMGWVLSGYELDLSLLKGLTFEDFFIKMKIEEKSDAHSDRYAIPKEKLKTSLLDCVCEIGEDSGNDSGTPIYVFTPPAMIPYWSERDRSIDYHEHEGAAVLKLKYIHKSLYPYSTKCVVEKSLKTIDERIKILVCADVDPNGFPIPLQQELKDLGFDLTQPLVEQIFFSAPPVVLEILKMMNEHIDEFELKPAIVTYWG